MGRGKNETTISKCYSQLLFVSIRKCHLFKFQQKRTINEEYDFFDVGRGGGEGTPEGERASIHKCIIKKHMKVLCFKLHQNRTINDEFDIWKVEGVLLGSCKSWHNMRTCFKTSRIENIEDCFCQNDICTLFVRGSVTFYTKSGWL